MECSTVLTPIGYLRVCSDGTVDFADRPSGSTGPDTAAGRLWTQYRSHLTLPAPQTDISTFSGRVLQALHSIPQGQTVTYAALAAMAGNPKAARAAARIVARNRMALIFPCHRVVPATGGYGNYRWGPERKQWLIEYEKKQTQIHTNDQKK
ncbi:MAG: methylated-DNA--[protein]-cysteine S-methyltransferase [Muribaculaceae bacterium]|nr:methylated-DNA--[protein]-cysteine S-methyltransferase [Muribaculaceae bacterium]